MGRIRAYFVSGLAILIPLAISLLFLRLLFGWMDGFLRPTPLLPRYYPGLGVVISLGLVLATGARLDMSVDEGLKLVMSGGMLMPQEIGKGGDDLDPTTGPPGTTD